MQATRFITKIRPALLAAVVLLLLAGAFPLHAQSLPGGELDSPPPEGVILWPIRFSGMMPQGFVLLLRQELKKAAAEGGTRQVLLVEDAWGRFAPKGFGLPNCQAGDYPCFLKAGKNLLVRYQLVATLEAGGKGWILDMKLLDVARRTIRGSTQAEFDGTPETIAEVMTEAVARLFVRDPVPIPKAGSPALTPAAPAVKPSPAPGAPAKKAHPVTSDPPPATESHSSPGEAGEAVQTPDAQP